jgi:hypothetical protein
MGQLNFSPSSQIYLDTVTIIYSIERFPEYVALLDPMWQQLQVGTLQVITSEITLLETLVMPIRQSNMDLIMRYERLLTASEVSLIPIDQTILKSAANLRATKPENPRCDSCCHCPQYGLQSIFNQRFKFANNPRIISGCAKGCIE